MGSTSASGGGGSIGPGGRSSKHARGSGATAAAAARSGPLGTSASAAVASALGGSDPRATTPAFVSTSASDLAALAVQTENYTWQFIGRAEPGLERPALRRDIRTLERQYLDATEHIAKMAASGAQGACVRAVCACCCCG